MIKPESKLWRKLKEGTREQDVFWTRLESWATPGIPDLHGIVDGYPFWLELKLHKLKSLNYINLSPHQIAWQIRYSGENGCVLNLVEHPSSTTINIFRGERAIEIGPKRKREGPLIPDWSSCAPYDWKGMIAYIVSHPLPKKRDQKMREIVSTHL